MLLTPAAVFEPEVLASPPGVVPWFIAPSEGLAVCANPSGGLRARYPRIYPSDLLNENGPSSVGRAGAAFSRRALGASSGRRMSPSHAHAERDYSDRQDYPEGHHEDIEAGLAH